MGRGDGEKLDMKKLILLFLLTSCSPISQLHKVKGLSKEFDEAKERADGMMVCKYECVKHQSEFCLTTISECYNIATGEEVSWEESTK